MTYIPYSTQAVIGYDNVFTAGTLTASSEQEGGEKENAVDGFTYDFWEPEAGLSPAQHDLAVQLSGAQAVDYLAIAAHNLGTIEGSITLQSSVDGSAWTTVAGPYSPDNDGPYLWRFAQASAAWWRVLIEGDEVSIGVINAGAAMVLPEGIYVGHGPATYNRDPEIQNAESEGGQMLGRSRLRTGMARIQIKQDMVTPAWVRATWDPFTRFAELRPFFYAWRSTEYPDEVAYGWSTGPAKAEHTKTQYMSVSLDMAGQVYEPRSGISGP